MTPTEFIELYRNYFGDKPALPIAVLYSSEPLGVVQNIPGCLFKQFHLANKGTTVSFSPENLHCGGGKLYTGLGPTPNGVYSFVSNIEKYKYDPSVAKASIDLIDAQISVKKYINFIRVDHLNDFAEAEGLIFLVTPDVLSGLFTWANYDVENLNAVLSPWGSGCSTTVTSLVNENRKKGKYCFIGLLDVSARPYFKSDILSFSIPMSRFFEMQQTLSKCCVAGSPAWEKLKKRINHG